MGYLLNHLLTEAAERESGAPALRYDEQSVDYAELETRSNRVARLLHDGGVLPGDCIGLHMRKSAEAIVALFGILKAGACAVPIATSAPAMRVRDIVEQCTMRCLIGSRQACESLGTETFLGTPLEWLVLTDGGADDVPDLLPRRVGMREAEAPQSDEALSIPTVDRDLAYVLFTSGSTGKPKGVMLSHRAVLTFVNWAGDIFRIRAEDRLSNHAPLNFDLSTFDIFAGTRAGASVVIVPENLSMFPVQLAELIERERISVWYSVPSVLSLLVTRGKLASRQLEALRLVLFAGEVFPIKYLRELMLAVPRPRYFNLYGPTETNVCTYDEVKTPPLPDARPIPIGGPCANTKTVVLDENGRHVAAGSEGLLYVGGSTLMDGYYGRPEETAAAFRANPQMRGREELLYCTGDWVTTDGDGDYVFVGRRDHMVKVGGYRIELGEIETALYSCPGVSEAAAIAIPDDLLGNRIKAVVVASVPDLDASALKRHCASLLPKYMVPQEVELRESLPRTPTDKLDRPLLVAESLRIANAP